MNPIIKEHIVSGLQTFASSFIFVFATTLVNGDIQWTSAFWISVCLTALRGAIKELLARFASPKFGGRSK